jgi:hypothetical protein
MNGYPQWSMVSRHDRRRWGMSFVETGFLPVTTPLKFDMSRKAGKRFFCHPDDT